MQIFMDIKCQFCTYKLELVFLASKEYFAANVRNCQMSKIMVLRKTHFNFFSQLVQFLTKILLLFI